ncbi:hypothetical protein LG52_3862 [Geobacillus kaustophilus]|uniref:Uncharacterized protein n=1 Tax=Geobacillus kaustophilus TaxID=1462 RepID=A0A0D8C7H9_GEOKU|nr:hypothetical protein LG52_3862 [Geobacillus kaustophilus]
MLTMIESERLKYKRTFAKKTGIYRSVFLCPVRLSRPIIFSPKSPV